jgi:hypothetical protein
MSDILMHKQINAIKARYGWADPPRFKLIDHRMHTCPGNIHHANSLGLSKIRKHRLFTRHVGHRHQAYVTYWRCHLADYRRYMSR